MTDALRGIVLPGEPTPNPVAHPAARYAVYVLEELDQVAFAGLAEAAATYEAQGVATLLATFSERIRAGDGQLADIVSELEAQGSGTALGRFTPHHPQGA